MKNFSILVAFIFVLVISSTALAENWVYVTTDDNDYEYYVDEDSIRYGVDSTWYDYSCPDGFSAHIKREKTHSNGEFYSGVVLVGFWTDDETGQQRFAFLGSFDENGNPTTTESRTFTSMNVDNDEAWIQVWNYIQNNLP